jgi:hypothetical protein
VQVLEPGTFDKLLVIEPMIFPPPAYQSTSFARPHEILVFLSISLDVRVAHGRENTTHSRDRAGLFGEDGATVQRLRLTRGGARVLLVARVLPHMGTTRHGGLRSARPQTG